LADDGLPRSLTENWEFFVSVQLWPRSTRFDQHGWLQNFTAEEMPFAIRLLEGFTFFSAEVAEAMFRGAFQNISQLVVQNKENYFSASAQWANFVDSLIIVRVEGHRSSDADSGYIFTRHARDLLGIDEHQILSPPQALERLRQAPKGNVVFVGIPFPSLMGPFVGVVEITCGFLIILGLLTRLASIPLILVMLVAIASTKIPIFLGQDFWIFHLPKLARYGFWSMAHEARADFDMLLGCLYLLIAGGGRWSLDAWLLRRQPPRFSDTASHRPSE